MDIANPLASPAMGTVLGGKYRLVDRIGVGGMGIVFAAINELTHKRVAIKWMLPRFAGDEGAVARFKREAKAAGRIDHPNVINVFDVGDEGGCPFLVMELLTGAQMAAAFAHAPLAPRVAVDLLLLAMRGVDAAHAQGVLHRDLKPENIFLCTDTHGAVSSAKVLDFGISKPIGDGDKLTQTGALMGTPRYMSPEQVRGHVALDARSDVYSLGVILYEALTARAPFEAHTFTALAVEIAVGTASSVRTHAPQVEEALDEAVMKAIARDRDERYADVASFARALEPFGSVKFADGSLPTAIDVPLGREVQIPIAMVSTPAGRRRGSVPTPETVLAVRPRTPTPMASVLAEPPTRLAPFIAVTVAVLGLVLAALWAARSPGAPPASTVVAPSPTAPPPARAARVPDEPAPTVPALVEPAPQAEPAAERVLVEPTLEAPVALATDAPSRRVTRSSPPRATTTARHTAPTEPAAQPAETDTRGTGTQGTGTQMGTFRTRGLSSDEF